MTFRLDARIAPDQRERLRAFCSELGENIVELANDLGVKVFEEELLPYESGYLEYAPTCGSASCYRIVINSRHSPERQRFTVAHELAHFLLHREKDDFVVSREQMHRSEDYFQYLEAEDRAYEAEANIFAATLLMPPNLFRPASERLEGDVGQLAKLFWVSEDAVRRRTRELLTR